MRFDISGDELRIYGPDGRRFLSYKSSRQRDIESHMISTRATQRVERMAAQLRAMGVEPAE